VAQGHVQELAKNFKGPADLCVMGDRVYVPDLVKGEVRILELPFFYDNFEELAEDVFRRAIRLCVDAGFRRVYVFGTAGEGYAVTERQFDEICGLFREEMSGPETDRIPAIVKRLRASGVRVSPCQARTCGNAGEIGRR